MTDISQLNFNVPGKDNAKSGCTIVTLEWCHYAKGLTLGYIQVTPMTKGDLPLARQVAMLPRLIGLCNKIAEGNSSASNPVLELETLRNKASEILQFIEKEST